MLIKYDIGFKKLQATYFHKERPMANFDKTLKVLTTFLSFFFHSFFSLSFFPIAENVSACSNALQWMKSYWQHDEGGRWDTKRKNFELRANLFRAKSSRQSEQLSFQLGKKIDFFSCVSLLKYPTFSMHKWFKYCPHQDWQGQFMLSMMCFTPLCDV